MAKSKRKSEPGKIVRGGAASAPPAPEPSGGGGLDMANPKDQAMLRKAMKRWPKRWAGIDDAKKQKWLGQLEKAGDVAVSCMDAATTAEGKLDSAKVVVSVVKTAVAIVGQEQADEHLEARLDAGDEGDGGTGPAMVFNIVLATPPADRKAPEHAPITVTATSKRASTDDRSPELRAAPKAG